MYFVYLFTCHSFRLWPKTFTFPNCKTFDFIRFNFTDDIFPILLTTDFNHSPCTSSVFLFMFFMKKITEFFGFAAATKFVISLYIYLHPTYETL